MIIGISGKAGSGKDTVADFLVRDYSYVKVALADEMKRICMRVFDFSYEQLWGPSEKRNEPDLRYPRGEKQLFSSGSTLVYVDAECSIALAEAAAQRPLTEAEKERIHDGYFKDFLTPRHALQQLGTEWGRSCYVNVWVDYALRVAKELLENPTRSYASKTGTYAKNMHDESVGAQALLCPPSGAKTVGVDRLWTPRSFRRPSAEYTLPAGTKVTVTGKKVEALDGAYYCYPVTDGSHHFWVDGSFLVFTRSTIVGVVIPDVRFENEIDGLKAGGAKLIRVKRPTPGLEGAAGQHGSELEQDSIPDSAFDFVLNNEGSLEELELQVKMILRSLKQSYAEELDAEKFEQVLTGIDLAVPGAEQTSVVVTVDRPAPRKPDYNHAGLLSELFAKREEAIKSGRLMEYDPDQDPDVPPHLRKKKS